MTWLSTWIYSCILAIVILVWVCFNSHVWMLVWHVHQSAYNICFWFLLSPGRFSEVSSFDETSVGNCFGFSLTSFWHTLRLVINFELLMEDNLLQDFLCPGEWVAFLLWYLYFSILWKVTTSSPVLSLVQWKLWY